MAVQGEFYPTVFHSRSVKPTFDVSRRNNRADSVITLVPPLLCLWCAQRGRCTLHCEFVPVFFFCCVQIVESITSTMLCVYLGSTEYRLFDLARDIPRAERERRSS